MTARPLLFALFLFLCACNTPKPAPVEPAPAPPATNVSTGYTYPADKAQLERTHARMQARVDTLQRRLDALAARVPPNSFRTERPTLELRTLRDMLGGDQHFLEERAKAIAQQNAARGDQGAFEARYRKLMRGHAEVVQEFDRIADRISDQVCD